MRSQHKEAQYPIKAFLTDIAKSLCNEKRKGYKILLCMDANTPWNHKDVQTLEKEVGLTDLMKAANRDSPPLLTYHRGNDLKGPIDLALGCQATADVLLTAGFH